MKKSRWLARALILCGALLLLTSPIVADGPGADSGGVGSYIVHRAGYDSTVYVANPTRYPMVSLMIVREPDGTLDSNACEIGGTPDSEGPPPNLGPCKVCEIPPHGTDDHCFDDQSKAAFVIDQGCTWSDSGDPRTMLQLVSVRTNGKFPPNGSNQGVVMNTRRNHWGVAMDPSTFKLSSGEASAIQSCVCEELGRLGLSPSLFSNVPGLGTCS